MTQLTDLISNDNLDDPVPLLAHKAAVYGLVISSLVLVTICVSMRLYVRFFVTRSPGYDDYCVTLTFVIIFAANIGCFFLVEAGLGEHLLILGLDGLAKFTHTFWWALGLYNMALALVKVSLLLQYLRIADERPDIQQPRLRMFTLVMIGIVGLWGVAQSLLAWIPCYPIEADWDFTDTSAIRWGFGSRDAAMFKGTFYQHSATNMVLDVIVLATPLFSKPLWATAKVDAKSRRGMIGLFFLGSITVSCSIIRFASQIKNQSGTYPSFDPTFYGSSVTVLSVLEVNLATIAATLPVFWPHLRRNIASIMVTREISVKITRQSAVFGHNRGLGSTSMTSSGGTYAVPNVDVERYGGSGSGGGAGGKAGRIDYDGVGVGDWGYDSRQSDDPWSLPKLSATLQLTEIKIDDKGFESGVRSESRAHGRSDSRGGHGRSGSIFGHVRKPSRLWTAVSNKE